MYGLFMEESQHSRCYNRAKRHSDSSFNPPARPLVQGYTAHSPGCVRYVPLTTALLRYLLSVISVSLDLGHQANVKCMTARAGNLPYFRFNSHGSLETEIFPEVSKNLSDGSWGVSVLPHTSFFHTFTIRTKLWGEHETIAALKHRPTGQWPVVLTIRLNKYYACDVRVNKCVVSRTQWIREVIL